MSPRRRLTPPPAGDDGVFAILYAAALMGLIGLVALVLDIGVLRIDRRANRAAADSAAVAGATRLGLSAQNPIGACLAAMRYAETTLGITSPGVDDCVTTFAGDPSTLCTTGTELTATETVDTRTIRVSWPVSDGSPLLEAPDLESSTNGVTQSLSSEDGVPCLRLGVGISQDRDLLFASIWGVGSTQTYSHSVAITAPGGGSGEQPAPLVVLSPHGCNVIDTNGGGSSSPDDPGGGVLITPSLDGKAPGAIALDSDGADCSGNNSIIDAGATSSSRVWALPTPSGIPAKIYSYALALGTSHDVVWNEAHTPEAAACPPFSSGSLPPPPPNLCPIPVPHGVVGRLPWDNRYNCVDTPVACPDADPDQPLPHPRNYVDQWVAYVNALVVPPPGWTYLSGDQCSVGDMAFAGDVYADCPGNKPLKVAGNVSIGGRLVTTGDVEVTGCLLLHDVDAGHCTTPPGLVDAGNPPPDGGNVYIDGNFSVTSGGSFVDNQSFVYVVGAVNVSTTGVVSWVAPYGDQLNECTPAAVATQSPTAACFQALALWDEAAAASNKPFTLLGPANTVVDGTMFMPNAAFKVGGSSGQSQQRAQFVCSEIKLSGGGLVRMTPDASRATSIPAGQGQLIR